MAPRTGRETRQLLKKSADALPYQNQRALADQSVPRNWDETLSDTGKIAPISAGEPSAEPAY